MGRKESAVHLSVGIEHSFAIEGYVELDLFCHCWSWDVRLRQLCNERGERLGR
jgi:hypothetical protein